MIVVLLNSYIAILALFVWLRFIPFNLFWKLSPVIVLIALLAGLFIPMGWGAPSGPAVALRNSVSGAPGKLKPPPASRERVGVRAQGPVAPSESSSLLSAPAQIRTCPIRAYGSYLGWLTVKRVSRSGWIPAPCCLPVRHPGRVTRFPGSESRACPPGFAFPSVPALGSAGSATSRPALFVGFTATVAECDFSRPFVAGYGSSPSRHGPTRR